MSLAGIEKFSIYNDHDSGQSVWRPTRPKMRVIHEAGEYTFWDMVKVGIGITATIALGVLSYVTKFPR